MALEVEQTRNFGGLTKENLLFYAEVVVLEKMRKILPVLFLFSSLSLPAAPAVFAQSEIPTNLYYYDWSSTHQTTQRQGVLGFQARAQEEASPATTAQPPSSPAGLYRFRYLFGANLTPKTPFYLLKRVQESVSLLTTFNPVEKEKLRLGVAAERLNEAEGLAQQGETFGLGLVSDSYQRTMSDVSDNLEKLQSQKKDILDLLKLLDLETAKHTIVLEKVLVLAPEQAKASIEKAREASWQGTDTVADLTGRPAVPPDVASRIAALKAMGLLTEEEANKLISVKTRSEAREEMKKYVQEGVVPESDFLRLNENLKTYYPQEFFQIHEIKRFYALKKLEEEKPDEATLARIQEFAKTHQAGQAVPADLRKFWGPIVQLEEIQATIRPDLVDPALFKNNSEDRKKFQEIIERYKPRPEDVAFLNDYLAKNPKMANNLPPEYARMKNLAEKFGAQCGPGMKWVQKIYGSQETGVVVGMCVPQDKEDEARDLSINPENRSCAQVVTSAKSPDGFCAVFPNACLPAGWTKVDGCTETPKSTGPGVAAVSCPSNSHFVSVYGPDKGYCLPNYTPVGGGGGGGGSCPAGYHRNYEGGPCLADFSERDSRGGYLPPLTVNPGSYPSPFYPPSNRCPSGQHWVAEPFNPTGGYCVADSYRPPGAGCVPAPDCVYGRGGTPRCLMPEPPGGWCPEGAGGASACPSGQYVGPGGICTNPEMSALAWKCSQAGKYWDGKECKDTPPSPSSVVCPSGQSYDPNTRSCTGGGYGGMPNPQMGNCRTPGECYDWCKANPSQCPGFNPNSPRPGDYYGPSREAQEAACRAGGGVCVSWTNNACGCERITNPNCRPPEGGCQAGKAWDGSACVCRESNAYPSTCAYPSLGCPSGNYWDYSSCSCKPSTGSGGGGYGGYGGYTSCPPPTSGCPGGMSWDTGTCTCKPPCPAGSSWNGSYCMPDSSPPSGYGSCPSGQYWNGSTCATSSSGESSSTPPPSSTPAPAPAGSTPPPQEPPPSTSAPSTPPTESGGGTSCPSGSYWNGSACVQGSQ